MRWLASPLSGLHPVCFFRCCVTEESLPAGGNWRMIKLGEKKSLKRQRYETEVSHVLLCLLARRHKSFPSSEVFKYQSSSSFSVSVSYSLLSNSLDSDLWNAAHGSPWINALMWRLLFFCVCNSDIWTNCKEGQRKWWNINCSINTFLGGEVSMTGKKKTGRNGARYFMIHFS